MTGDKSTCMIIHKLNLYIDVEKQKGGRTKMHIQNCDIVVKLNVLLEPSIFRRSPTHFLKREKKPDLDTLLSDLVERWEKEDDELVVEGEEDE